MTAELLEPGDPDSLLAMERQLLGRAAPNRARDFAAGRECAHAALLRLGVPGVPLLPGSDRRPQWPQQVIGSITHTCGFTAAAVAERRQFKALGIDAERVAGMSRDLWNQVFLPAESLWLKGLAPEAQAGAATLVFSAKEAFYKCQFEITGQWLEFTDVRVDLVDGILQRGRMAVTPVGHVELLQHASAPWVVEFACTGGLALTAMSLAVN